ncbi:MULTISPECIES: type II toxin-antitoxin system HicB family antitoxin [Bacteroides]|jgi:predicted RNase H-like HicB family nuclease|uniref:Type II toxin-antitoxin system HicB family antitoxin n=2 Tax=Bacteroides TaxID=816 RepID=A0ABT5HDY6_9BACE|nr:MULTISPECIES: type II toxin-antitoxin system HicB family antitoxin [Bacteroides]MBC5603771.1 type II toxin-antitoxin system HicB family antitoxin [Bacteroides difficilis]MDC7138684.1 type II toxin-antitoxin system HicB family antitoxin [Bacteroides zhangwenhongii]OKZ23795.1 MAG: HicB family protein [Bacteroides finegoldii]
MRTITATIEKASDGGYGIYTDIPGLIGSGLTEEEAKADFCGVLKEQAAYYYERTNTYPDWYKEGYEIEYRYDLSGFFLSFPFINASEFASYVGINPSLMRKYKSGLVKASAKQKDQIQAKYSEMIRNLERVKF